MKESSQNPEAPAMLEVHIEELVLRGFAPGDGHRIGDALQSEMARLLAQQGLPAPAAKNVSIERLDGGSFKTTPGARASTLGAQVAANVYRRLSQPSSAPAPQPKPDRRDR